MLTRPPPEAENQNLAAPLEESIILPFAQTAAEMENDRIISIKKIARYGDAKKGANSDRRMLHACP